MSKEDLIKDLDKSFERKKPIEKIKPKTVKGNKKPREALPVEKVKKKPPVITKEEIKIVEDSKKVSPVSIVKERKKESVKELPVIEYEIHKTIKFDLNWYYFKRLFLGFEKWLSAPYTKEFWIKRGFNEKEKSVTITNSFNDKVIVEKIKESPVNIKHSIIKEEIKKPLSNEHWSYEAPLTADEIMRIKRIRELLKSDELIFRSDK